MNWFLFGMWLVAGGGLLVAAVMLAFIVLMFRTGHRSPDPRGVLLPAAFAGSVTLAGVVGLLLSVAWLGVLLGQQAVGTSVGSRCFPAEVEYSTSGSAASLAQEDEQTPPPGYRPPVFTPPTIIATMPPFPEPSFIPPGDFIEVPRPSFRPRQPAPRLPPSLRPDACEDGSAGKIVATLPWLLVSGVAAGGGSRHFRRMLKEERSHDRA